MTTSLTLPTGPFEQVAMDYVHLRDEGIALLGQLAGTQWTDYNTHDPGITILEQLCYAITDLGYRIGYPIPDLISPVDPGLPGPDAILTTDPVTAADLRRAALDVDGVGNAWVESPSTPSCRSITTPRAPSCSCASTRATAMQRRCRCAGCIASSYRPPSSSPATRR